MMMTKKSITATMAMEGMLLMRVPTWESKKLERGVRGEGYRVDEAYDLSCPLVSLRPKLAVKGYRRVFSPG